METPPVYVAEPVYLVQALYAPLITPGARPACIRDHLERLADRLHAGLSEGHPGADVELARWHPDPARAPRTREAARLTVARAHGFDTWQAVAALGEAPLSPAFEAAVDALVAGHAEALQRLLIEYPALAARRSPYGHGATLLHYLTGTGVELYRQAVPLNAPALVRLLIGHGADARAVAHCDGRPSTALALATVSPHPVAAGIDASLIEALVEAARAATAGPAA
ncbi:MAG: hypothetical protein AB7O67_07910 [Vicinamibacterales bacterium]